MDARGVIGILILVAIGGYFVFLGLDNTGSTFVSLSELPGITRSLQSDETFKAKIRGEIEKDSIVHTEYGMSFTLVDDAGDSCRVQFNGVAPQNLQTGREIAAVCKISKDGVVQSDELIVKCPSKYEGEGG